MGTAKCIGRAGALAVALGVGIAVANTPGVAFAGPADAPSDRTALVMGTSGIPTPDDFWVESVKKQFIAPTHPRQDIEYVKVTTAEEVWPFTGLFRLLCLAAGPQDVCGPNGPAWPDEPLWKLSGLFDLTLNQSVQAGLADLETAMERQRRSGDLRLLTERVHREPGEAQARRAVPGGNQGPRHRLRIVR